ncbi:MAG: leucyl aminopeptidase [Candidatus Pelagibacter sp. TMED64]|nr:leucyl aminopeptidase [Candidatus Pelagibacter sp.]OUU67327.1 MAG: leucyl aminopeptidase [Candidatus Pelagibacter sp. TMED64]|tara:strand:+ start:6351 stop:7829 length:1479 start_codon:yes stop_codon:yes gene_type:complete
MLIFDNNLGKNSDALAIFVSEKYDYKDPRGLLSKEVVSKINSFLKILKGKNEKDEINSLDISDKKKCFIIKIKKKYEKYYPEEIGGTFFSYIKNFKHINSIDLYADSLSENKERTIKFISEFTFGFQLKSYTFNKYKTLNKDKINKKINFKVITSYKEKVKKEYKYYDAIKEGVFLSRDLVSEPPNVLNPKKYTEEIKKLSKLGLKIEILNEAKLKKMGMNSLLGVGQGSENETFLVVIKWNGAKNNFGKPLAFVGKGVCFDTGGISLKPARFMEEMKYDMGGSAVVVGLMKSLAIRKAKINAVGVVGLVENMPDGNAQRPGDIVKSYSGKTIEVLNTDAEGRLVLADALTYTEERFKPKFIIDLATLTGAIIMALGEEYAGLFSNDDELSKNIFKSSENVNEKVWRLPLHKNYDKLMDSPIADVQNINYAGGAGSITAAQFLQRFILNKTPWAHLDIAGMAFSKKAANLNPGGATGFGVRLLNNLIKEFYE